MRFYLLAFLIFTVVLGSMAQDNCSLMHNANWIWEGSDTSDLNRTTVQISFTSDSFVVDTIVRSMEIGSQNTTMSDETGNLLFYSNGCYIANSNDLPIENSDTLNPGPIFNSQCKGRDGSYIGSQGMFTLPAPENDSLYYILHKRFNWINEPPTDLIADCVFATTVNPYSNSLKGKVIEKNFPLILDTIVSSNFSATRHADGSSWWILTPNSFGNGFFRILLTDSGFDLKEMQFIGGVTSTANDAGQAKFSPDGSRFAMYHSKSGVFLFDFDRQTGLLSNYRFFGPIDSSIIIGGCEFSPSGRFLYANTMNDLFQYDVEVEDIGASEVHLGQYDGYLSPFPTRFYHMERTPHGQIFMNSPNQVNVLHVIENPDKKGLACNFKQHSIILPAYIFWSMPHFPNYRLGAMGDPLCDTTVSARDVSTRQVSISVYPNPVRDNLTIEIPQDNYNVEVTLVDMSGRVALTAVVPESNSSIDVSGVAPGMYVLRVEGVGGYRHSLKVVVQ